MSFAASYKKAPRFLPEAVTKLIRNLQPTIAWSPSEHYFCYRRDIEAGHEYIIFDLPAKSKQPLFDHAWLAKKIGQQLSKSISPQSLPIENIQFKTDEIIQFHIENFMGEYHLRTRELNFSTVPEITAMLHCPSVLQLWGLSPTQFALRLRSPDQHWEIYCRNFNLFLYGIAQNKEYQLTTNGDESQPYATSPDTNLTAITLQRLGTILPPMAIWSPDSQKVVTFQCDQRAVEKLPLLQSVPEDQTFRPRIYDAHVPFVGDNAVPLIQLGIIDINKKTFESLPLPPLLPALVGSPIEAGYVWWSSDSQKIFFIREERGNHKLSLCEYHLATAQLRTIITETSHQYVETDQLILWQNYTQVLEGSREVIWLSNRNGWNHLYLYDLATGKLTNAITQGEWMVRKVLHVDISERWIYFLGNGKETNVDPYYRYLYRARLDGSEVQCLTPELADHTIVFSPSQQYFVDYFSTMNSIPATTIRQKNGQEVTLLAQADFTQLFDLGYKQPQPFCVKGADDETDIYGVIYFPSDFDATKKYPIIDDIYPGPQLTRVPKTYCIDPPEYFYGCWWPQTLAELGFIVINIDGRGTPLRSRKFHHYSYQHLETAGGLEDHVTVLKRLAQEYSYLDINKVGILGQSAGGYAATRALLDYPDFFRVGVCVSGLQDLRSYLAFWGERYQGLPTEINYIEQSNYRLAAQLKGQLFLIHGDMDDNVHPANTLQLVDALIKADKDFDMLIVPNGNHGLYFINDYVRRKIWDYFIQHLLN